MQFSAELYLCNGELYSALEVKSMYYSALSDTDWEHLPGMRPFLH